MWTVSEIRVLARFRWLATVGVLLGVAVRVIPAQAPRDRVVPPTAEAAASTRDAPSPATPSSLVVGLGLAHLRAIDRAMTWRVEYRHRALLPWRVQPFAGLDLGSDRSRYVFVGVLRAIPLGAWWRVTPSFGVGRFSAGTFALGHPLEFRSGVELGVRLSPMVEMGAAVHHVSNGGLGRRNPGSEQVVVLTRIPLR